MASKVRKIRKAIRQDPEKWLYKSGVRYTICTVCGRKHYIEPPAYGVRFENGVARPSWSRSHRKLVVSVLRELGYNAR